jgi:hypothetical protein
VEKVKKFDCKLCKLFTIFILSIIFLTCPSITYAEGEKLLADEDISIILHLNASDHLSGVSKVMISTNSDLKGAQWEDYTEEKEVIIDKNAEDKTVYVKYMDNAGNVSKVYYKIIPEKFFEETIFIDNDDLYTNKDKITLKINTTEDAEEMRFSRDNVNWSDWEEFKNEIEYVVKGKEGKKKIYNQFKDKDGQIIKKLVYGAVIYDKTPPTIENVILFLDEKTNKVNVSAEINDNLSGIQLKKWTLGEVDLEYFKKQGTDFNENSITVDENGDYTIYAVDKAGNASTKKFTVNIIKNTKENEKESVDNGNKKTEDKSNEDLDKTNNIEKANKNEVKVEDKHKETTNKETEDNVEESNDIESEDSIINTDKKDYEKDTVSEEKEEIKDNKTNQDKKEDKKVDKNSINNHKNSSEKITSDKGLKHLWLLLLLILIIIYLLYKKYKKYKKIKK